MRPLKVLIEVPYELSIGNITQVFNHRLEELTEGWYIAISTGHSGVERKGLCVAGSRVLCHDGLPHPHDGDSDREYETSLNYSGFEVIRAAVELRDALRKGKRS